MDNRQLIEAALSHVRDELRGDTTGHDWLHTQRVWTVARLLAREEQADPTVVELAALLHDIRDWKIHGDPDGSTRYARHWLRSHGADARTVEAVCEVIDAVSFKGESVPETVPSNEAAVVRDADRLDAIGAIGIARAFAFGGAAGRPIHDPAVLHRRGMGRDEYRQHAGTTINHFAEKLLLLKDRMRTAAGRRIAEERHRFVVEFLDRFHREWDGQA